MLLSFPDARPAHEERARAGLDARRGGILRPSRLDACRALRRHPPGAPRNPGRGRGEQISEPAGAGRQEGAMESTAADAGPTNPARELAAGPEPGG